MKLSDYGFNKFSQFGEDGIIEKIFEIIGTQSLVCIEFGAWDGFYYSNTANLWSRNDNWKGILIECVENRYQELLKNTKDFNCHCIKAMVTPDGTDTLENILQREGLGFDVDLLSIDVDGDDYHIFNSLQQLHPRLVICEYNPTIPPMMKLIPTAGNRFGCSAISLVELATLKDYRLVSVTKSNCFFVRESDFHLFNEFETDLESLAVTELLTYFISGYDGTFILSREPIYRLNQPSHQTFNEGDYYRVDPNQLKGLTNNRFSLRHFIKNLFQGK